MNSEVPGNQKGGHVLSPSHMQIDKIDEGEVFTQTHEEARPQSQIVFPPDTRQRVPNTTQSPYDSIGQLIMTFPNGVTYGGTGTLIDEYYVLTAAHNLFGRNKGGWATSVHYIPARNGNTTPYGNFQASKLFITEEYRLLSPPDPDENNGVVKDYTLYTEDYGLVKLSRGANQPIFGMFPANDGQLNTQVTITGYPGDKQPANTMWTDTGVLGNPDDTFLFYRVNTFYGESGAGVLANLQQSRWIIGVHVGGDPALNSNFGVRLTQDVINQINAWMYE